MSEIIDKYRYNGDIQVTISRPGFGKKTIKTHNAGEQPLFDFLEKCLCGSYSNNERPHTIRIFAGDNEVLRSPISIYATHDNASHAAVMEASFTKSDIATMPSSSALTLKMYNSSSYELASANLTLNLSSLEDGVHVLIQWRMSFTNPQANN